MSSNFLTEDITPLTLPLININMDRSPSADSFTVGLIYIKPLEMAAITTMLDERFDSVPTAHGDPNTYVLGRIGDHNVAVTGPARGDQGTTVTAQLVSSIRLTFPNITVGLLVGVGGGIPHYPKHDVRLGDVVVGAPEWGPAVVQYDFGIKTEDGFEPTRGLALPQPPQLVRQVVNHVEDKYCRQLEGEDDILKPHLDRFTKFPKLREYRRPTARDRLFQPTYVHEQGTDCANHDARHEQIRKPRGSDHVQIHYSTILSGNSLMMSAEERDRLSANHNNALCFEMGAAGLMAVFPCLVIRGICDYCDSHKNFGWQAYAAATAAAYAREFLLSMSKQTPRMPEIVESAKATLENPPGLAKTRDGVVVSGTYNYGVQVGHNSGALTNNFGPVGGK